MPLLLNNVNNLRPLALFEGKDSPLVVFGAASAKLASTFGGDFCHQGDYLAPLGIARHLPKSGYASVVEGRPTR